MNFGTAFDILLRALVPIWAIGVALCALAIVAKVQGWPCDFPLIIIAPAGLVLLLLLCAVLAWFASDE